jgi:hypothetical protein
MYGELSRGLPGREHYKINNLWLRLYDCDFKNNKHPNLKPEINFGVIITPWSPTLREERRLRVFENRVLRRIFGPKRDEVTGEC